MLVMSFTHKHNIFLPKLLQQDVTQLLSHNCPVSLVVAIPTTESIEIGVVSSPMNGDVRKIAFVEQEWF